jgi:hypothetical protein
MYTPVNKHLRLVKLPQASPVSASTPLPLFGPLAEALFLRRYMLALIHERNAVIKQIAESSEWHHYLSYPEALREDLPQ